MKKFCSEKRERVKSAEKSGLTEATKGDKNYTAKYTAKRTREKMTGKGTGRVWISVDDVRKFNNLIIVIIAATFDGCRLDFMSKGERESRGRSEAYGEKCVNVYIRV